MKQTRVRRAVTLLLAVLVLIAIPAGALWAEETAVFAGGCFWCMEEAFEQVEGVSAVVSGYTGGDVENPTYRQVTSGFTGHTEAVQVNYDETVVSYEDLLYIFWRNVDLLDSGGQFCDRGDSYRTGIFYANESQRRAAQQSKSDLAESGRFNRPIVTEITELDVFYEAEGYHQDYYLTNPGRYSLYKSACGRVRRLTQLWGEEGATHEAP